jgi:hypothetical protein
MEPHEVGRAMFGENAGRLPLNNPSAALEAFRVVKTGDGWLCGFTVTNTKASVQFVLVFDARDLPPEGAVPLIGKSLPASDALGMIWIPPRRFEAGLVLCNSSTQGSKTIGSADCLFDAQYF